MSLSLTARTKNIILLIESDPEESFGLNITIPFELLKNMKNFLIECAEKQDNGDLIIKREITNNALELTIRQVLLKLYPLGYTYDKDRKIVEEALKYVIGYMVQNYPGHISWHPFNIGINLKNETIKKIDRQINLTKICFISPWYELMYGVEQGLFFWNGRKWQVTDFGDYFKDLPLSSGTVFLLLLENYYCSQGNSTDIYEINPWHMSREYLSSFFQQKSICVDIGGGEYSLLSLDPNMNYLNRLDEFNLIRTFNRTEERRGHQSESEIPIFYLGDDFYEIVFTDFGIDVIKHILYNKDSLLSIFIEKFHSQIKKKV